MAEVVQRHLESMAEEFEEMRKTKLYTLEEIRVIKKKREQFEYKVNGVSKNIQDLKDYLEFEKLLLKQIQCRRDRYKISDRKASIEFKIRRRMKSLYEILLQRFPNDFASWLAFLKFCKQSNFIGPATQVIQGIIKHFSYNPEIWQIASHFYAYDRKEIKTALEVLYKGLSIHKDSQMLYLEAIKLELSRTSVEDPIEEDLPEEELEMQKSCAAKIEKYLKAIFETIKDSKFLIELLDLLEAYAFTMPMQSLIIERLIECHSDEAVVWHTLAQREMRDLHHSSKGETFNYATATGFTFCVEKYKQGLKQVSAGTRSELWAYYIDFLVRAHQEGLGSSGVVSSSKSLKLLLSALEQAGDEKCLSEKYYMIWLEYVKDEDAAWILEKATNTTPQSVELWKLRLNYATLANDTEQVKQIFKVGITALKERSLPLWLTVIRYGVLALDPEVVESIYREGVRQPPEISQVLKPKYIEWIVLTKDIEEARKVYAKLALEPPFCKELHAAMCKMECTGTEYDTKALERIHRLACNQFGKKDVTVWLNYAEFHLTYNKKDLIHNKVQQVYKEAMASLSPLLTLDFSEKFQKLLAEQQPHDL